MDIYIYKLIDKLIQKSYFHIYLVDIKIEESRNSK